MTDSADTQDSPERETTLLAALDQLVTQALSRWGGGGKRTREPLV